MSLKLLCSPEKISGSSWNNLLHSSTTANFFHTKEAFEFYKNANVDEPFFFAVSENNNLVGLLIGLILKEKGIQSFFSRRAICFGGPVLDDSISDFALKSLLNFSVHSLRKQAIYIEFRNFNDYERFKPVFAAAGFEYRPHLNFHVDCTNRNDMEKRVSNSKLRQVRKSLKQGAEIIEATTKEQVKQFYLILKELYETRVKTPLLPESIFVKFFEQNVGRYLLIRYNNEIIGGIMCPILDSRVIYEWFVCGKDRLYNNIYPSILATWAAMDFANRNGIARFDFMGAGSPEEYYGVRDFKAKFGGDLVEHGRFRLVNKKVLYKIGKIAVNFRKKRSAK